MLYRCCSRGFRDFGQQVDAKLAVVACDADFNELMCAKADINFFQDGGCQAFVAYHDDRVEAMGHCFERFALAGGQAGAFGCAGHNLTS